MPITVTMVTVIVVTRENADKLNQLSNYTLIYGRRKVGKTFLVKNFLEYDHYAIVKRGGGMIVEDDPLRNIDSFDVFLEYLKSKISEGKTMVIDEFQRLPEDFLDHVQSFHPDGRLILTGSSFHVMKDILSARSPLLGLVAEFKLSLISPKNIYTELSEHMGPQRAFELSPYLRDPWTLQYFRGVDTDLEDILIFSKESLQSLLGEVFLEEERTLSTIYEGIIRALAVGKWKLKEIADMLYSRKLINEPDPSKIRPYFNNMMSMDLVHRIPLHHKQGYRYLIRSPIMDLGYLMDERYNFFDEDIPRKKVKSIIDNKTTEHIERFCGEFFSRIYGGNFEYFYSDDFDIDFIITEGKKVLAVGEVKWSENVSKKDVYKFLERTEYLSGDKIFFSKRELDVDGVISLTPEHLLNIVKRKGGKPLNRFLSG